MQPEPHTAQQDPSGQIRLEPVTRDNFWQVVRLEVAPEQREFVATNAFSLAESKFYPELMPFAVYAGEQPVGFLMHGLAEDTGQWWIVRLMIAADQQGKGYGRAAITRAIADIRRDHHPDALYISFEPENHTAKQLYVSLGFEPTGEWDGSETVYCLQME